MEKPLDSPLTIDATIHEAVMALPHHERRDRAKAMAAMGNYLHDDDEGKQEAQMKRIKRRAKSAKQAARK